MLPGVAGAANTGFAHARGEFVARIDSDDIMLQNRIAVQVRFMDEHPEVAVCGSWVQTFGISGEHIWRLPVSHEEICVWMLFYGALANPSVMIRWKAFEDHRLYYDDTYGSAEDYELWTRAARKVRLANVPRVLLRYRTHLASLSTTDRSRTIASVRRVHERQLRELGLAASADELDLHWRISERQFEATPEFKSRTAEWFKKLKAANDTAGILDREQLARFLSVKLDEIGAAMPAAVPATAGAASPPHKKRFATLRGALKAILTPTVSGWLVRSAIVANDTVRSASACLPDRSLLVRTVVALTPPILLPLVRRSYRAGKAILRPAAGGDQLQTAETLSYYREVKGSTTVGADIWSDVPLDIVFVAADQDLDLLPLAVEGVRRNLRHPIKDIAIVGPADSRVKQHARQISCRYVCEHDVLPIRKRDIKYTVKGVDRSGWLLQQFLKLGADAIVGTDRYLVVDADTILIKPQIFVAGDSDVLLHSEEYHHPYFLAYEFLVNLDVKTRVSAVAHHMLFNRSRLASLKSRMEHIGSAPWYMSIINASDLTDLSCVSECETYGQWCIANYPETTHREFAFNLTLPRRLISSVDIIMQQHARDWRSVSFHWYYEPPC
jgi:hypothetical protein